MLSDEEKKAIETIKDFKNLKWYEHAFDNGTEVLDEEQKQDIEIILNLIEKQSKEIEELKKQDKIKAKIEPVLKQLERKMQEEYNKYGNSREYQNIVDAYNFLQSLLEKEE